MIFFLIPFRSQQSTADWKLAVNLLNNTLKSIFNQTELEFKVIIACHETPKIVGDYGHRLEIIQVNYPPPDQIKDHLTDKYYKKRFLANKAQAFNGKYIMFVDADDYISNRLVNWVNNHEHPSGWFIKTGYEYDASKNYLRITPRLNNICGTSAILNISILNDPIETAFNDYKRENEYLFDYGHNEWNKILKKRKVKTLGVIPFKGAVYVLNTGINWTQSSGQYIGPLRKMYRRLHPGIKVDQKFKKEFFFDILEQSKQEQPFA